MRVRMVDLESDRYRIARTYMIRLRRSDLEAKQLARIAAQTTLSPEAFKKEFAPVFAADVDPVRSLSEIPPPVVPT